MLILKNWGLIFFLSQNFCLKFDENSINRMLLFTFFNFIMLFRFLISLNILLICVKEIFSGSGTPSLSLKKFESLSLETAEHWLWEAEKVLNFHVLWTGQFSSVIYYYCSTKMAYSINQNIETDSNQITSSVIYFKSLLKSGVFISKIMRL
jgi:hypothetical protein